MRPAGGDAPACRTDAAAWPPQARAVVRLAGNEVLDDVEVVYETIGGWLTSTAHVRRFADLPPGAQLFVRTIEQHVGVPGTRDSAPLSIAQLAARPLPTAVAVGARCVTRLWPRPIVAQPPPSRPALVCAVKWIGVGPSRDAVIEVA